MMTAQDVATAPSPPRAPAAGHARAGARRVVLPLVVLAVIAGAGVLVWRTYFAAPPIPASIVTLTGRIDGDDSAIAPKQSGKILAVTVREGDSVRAGDVLAVLDDSQIRAQEDQARAAVTTAQAQAQAASAQIAVFEQQLTQNQLQTSQAAANATGQVRQAEANVAAAQASFAAAQANVATTQATLAQQQAADKNAAFNQQAFDRLAGQGAVSEQDRVQADAAADQANAAVRQAAAAVHQAAAAANAARQQVASAQGALVAARAALVNPEISRAATAAVEKQIAQQQSMVASAQAQVAQQRAALAVAEANRADLIVRAPFSGTVITRSAEPGEVVQAGTAIVTLLNLNDVYLRGFIPDDQIGLIKVGQPAHVYLDSNPGQAVDAYVIRIDPEATFTPENTYFRDDRVKQVFGVKLELRGAYGYAKPGMPADGEILIQGSAWPAGWKGWHSP